jgi:cyclic pyranopterin phosphate synthase
MCLFAGRETDLRGPLRSGASDEELARITLEAVGRKEAGHGMADPAWTYVGRPMSMVAG